jgi:tetratricopeptide (TPR) repeat protein
MTAFDEIFSLVGKWWRESLEPSFNALGLQKYMRFIFFAVAFVFLVTLAKKILSPIITVLLKPLYRFKANREETERTKLEKRNVMKQVEQMLKQQDYKAAANLLDSIEQRDEAAGYYVQAGDYSTAAEIYESLGNLEKAASLYKEAGNSTKAAGIFLQLKDYKSAASMYEKGGFSQKAAEIYENEGEFGKAAELYENCFAEESSHRGSTTKEFAMKSGKLFERVGVPQRAAKVYLRAGMHADAAAAYEMTQDFIKAGDCYLKVGNLQKAAACFAEGGDDRRSNEILSMFHYQKGLLRDAASYSEKAGDFLRAAEILVETEEFSRAATLYENLGLFQEAGEIFLRIDDFLRAAEAFEKAGNFVLAAKAYHKAGCPTVKVGELFEKGCDYFEAGNLYLQSGLPDKALEAFQMINPESENYIPASISIGTIFFEKGMLKLAFEKFRKVIGTEPINKSNIEAYYYIGRCFESAGKNDKAKAVYSKVLSERYNFRDVRQRIAQL